MKIKIGLKFKARKIEIDNVKKLNKFEKGMGLMFRCRDKCPAMLFKFKNPTRMNIHSLFVFFPFVVIWLDNKNKVVDMKIVKPFRILVSCKKSFYKILEIPLNKRYQKQIKFLFKK